jgi:hypothetical protein
MTIPFNTELDSLIYKSILKNTWKVYQNAKNRHADFRKKIMPNIASSYYSYN